MNNEQLKQKVYNYWNARSCGTEITREKKFSEEYFEQIESFRYTLEPEIFSFAQFSRFHGKRMLEVGVGAGTDFSQWVRSGAKAYGVDLTREAIENTAERLALYGLKAEDLRVADAQNLPHKDDFFDLVYSWGVIHHAPDMEQCLSEIIRVTKPNGVIKIMVYNRRSLFAVYRYILAGVLRGKPFQRISTVLFHHQESLGTKAYTRREIKKIVKKYPASIVQMQSPATQHDLLYYKSRFVRGLAYCCACLFGWRSVGWFMMVELKKDG